MNERLTTRIAAVGLFTGGILGMVGSFVSSSAVRGLAWGIDGIALIVATALLTIYFFRKGYDGLAAGFLIFVVGESLILSYNAADLNEDVSSFGAGTALWATSLVMISFQNVFHKLIRFTGFMAAVMFSIVSVQIFAGGSINALTQPLPFFAYPFFVVTIFGWGWKLLHWRPQLV